MVDDVQCYIEGMKQRSQELRASAGKIPAEESLVAKIHACTEALKLYDDKVAPLKRAMAQNKPKKVKGAKAKASPKAAAPEPAAAPKTVTDS